MMTGKGARRTLVLVLAVSFLLGPAASDAGAYHRDRYRELQRKITNTRARLQAAERRETDLINRLARSDRTRAALERRLSALTDLLVNAQARYELLSARLERISAQLEMRTAQLENALGALEDQTRVLNQRARAFYTMGNVEYGSVVLRAQDLNSAVVGFEYTRSVLREDSEVLDGVRAAKVRMQEVRTQVVSKRREVQAATSAQRRVTRRISDLRSEQSAARRRVVGEIRYRQTLLGRVRDQQKAYQRALQSYITESRSITAFLRGAQRGQRAVQGRGGYLRWPVSGRITSGYGWRRHPVYGYRNFHTGIDIGAPTGATVRAARYGRVLYTGYRGAYGLVALVDHGRSVATMYAHLSRVYVRPGQRLGTGSSVGAIGCTGWCTGPHLHFEVRVNGEPTNPLRWL